MVGKLSQKSDRIFIILQKRVSIKAFRRVEELQETVVPLSNIFNNKFDDLINSSDKKNVISCRQNRNSISLQLPAIKRNRVAGHFEPEEKMEGVKGDISDVSFLYQ